MPRRPARLERHGQRARRYSPRRSRATSARASSASQRPGWRRCSIWCGCPKATVSGSPIERYLRADGTPILGHGLQARRVRRYSAGGFDETPPTTDAPLARAVDELKRLEQGGAVDAPDATAPTAAAGPTTRPDSGTAPATPPSTPQSPAPAPPATGRAASPSNAANESLHERFDALFSRTLY